MTGTAWLYGGLLAFGVVQLLLTWYLVRLGADGPAAASVAEDHTDRHADAGSTVQCHECETVNEAGYRFCRACVAELPGADDRVLASRPSGTGNVF